MTIEVHLIKYTLELHLNTNILRSFSTPGEVSIQVMRRLWAPKRRRLRRFEVLGLQLLLGLQQLLLQAWRR